MALHCCEYLRLYWSAGTYLPNYTSWCPKDYNSWDPQISFTPLNRVLSEKLTVLSESKNYQYFMEPEGSLPHSQQPFTCPYAEPDQSSPCPCSSSLKSILILSSYIGLGLVSGLFSSGLSTRTLYAPLLSPMHATCSDHLIIFYLITWKILKLHTVTNFYW
jgi:hypothetical protein